MRLLIASDIHGDIKACEAVISAFSREGAEKLLLLGDILYHGPRNDLPEAYAPKEVIKSLNEMRDKILAVRGNCDTEVDQMVLSFPILSDYAYISDGTVRIIATHGHKFNKDTPPALSRGDILLSGHTHIPAFEKFGDGNVYINPGSAALPKEKNPKTYMVYDRGEFTLKELSGKVIFTFNKDEI